MCGHATVAATWLLAQTGRLVRDRVSIRTKSGIVDAQISRDGGRIIVEISQPAGRIESVDDSMAGVITEVQIGIVIDSLHCHGMLVEFSSSAFETALPGRTIPSIWSRAQSIRWYRRG